MRLDIEFSLCYKPAWEDLMKTGKIHPKIIEFFSKKTVLSLFLLSLTVRAVFMLPLASTTVPPKYDQWRYFARAVAYNHVYTDLAKFEKPAEQDVKNAIPDGNWPPVHPALMGLVFFIFGERIIFARIFLILISALTTLLVFYLTQALFGRKSAVWAAILHALYPPFIAYSLLLFSETTFFLFLLLSFLLAVKSTSTSEEAKARLLSLASGAALGVAALTRATGLLYFPVFIAWIFFKTKNKREKLIKPVLFILFYCVLVIPWQIYISTDEDVNIGSAASSFALYGGNNPWTFENRDAISQKPLRQLVMTSVREYAAIHNTTWEKAARELMTQTIKTDFSGYISQVFERVRILFSYNVIALRQFTSGLFPLIPGWLLFLHLIVLVLSFVFFTGFIFSGFLADGVNWSKRILFLALVAVTAGPLLMVYNASRYNLPILVLLLPLAGHGITCIGQFIKMTVKSVLVWCIMILVLINLVFLPLNPLMKYQSSAYANVLKSLDGKFGIGMPMNDIITLRVASGEERERIILRFVTEGFVFKSNGKQEFTVTVPGSGSKSKPSIHQWKLNLFSYGSSKRPEIKMISNLRGEITISPVNSRARFDWSGTDWERVYYRWEGGAHPVSLVMRMQLGMSIHYIVPLATSVSIALQESNKVHLAGINYESFLNTDEIYLAPSYLSINEISLKDLSKLSVESFRENDVIVLRAGHLANINNIEGMNSLLIMDLENYGATGKYFLLVRAGSEMAKALKRNGFELRPLPVGVQNPIKP